MLNKEASNKKIIASIFFIALAIRLIFSFYFQQFYFGKFTFTYADTSTYLTPILNLFDRGEFIGDKFIADSRYFRPPVYPFFLGFFYSVFSQNMFEFSVAATQCVLGATSAVFVYLIVLNISRSKGSALYSGILFACYPFVILWTPILYPETLYIFLTLLLVYLTSDEKLCKSSVFVQGCVLSFMILTKQYLGVFLIIPVFAIFFSYSLNPKQKLKQFSVFLLGVFLVLSPWVARNYVASGKVIVLMGETSGLRNYQNDMVAFLPFASGFDENQTSLIDSVSKNGVLELHKHPSFVERHKNEIESASMLAFRCGSSFQERRNPTSLDMPPYKNCDNEVVDSFNKLNMLYWNEVPIWEALETRRDALWKIIGKSDLVNKRMAINKSDLFKYALFKYRVALLLLGFASILYLLKSGIKERHQKVLTVSIIFVAMSLYCYFCLVLVRAEMRYLLTADIIISMFSGVIPFLLIVKVKGRFAQSGKLTTI